MSAPIVVNIQTYGDFDMLGSRAIMLAPAGATHDDIKAIIDTLKEQFYLNPDVDTAINELKKHGFSETKSYDLNLGVGL